MAIDTAVEEVASNLEEIAEATRRINTKSAGFVLGGLAIGFGIGFYVGRRWNREKLRAEAFEQSAEEVERIRQAYFHKDQEEEKPSTPVVVVAVPEKPSAEDVIQERGYARPLKPPVPGLVDPRTVSAPPPQLPVWDYQREIAGRLDGEPYVIHQDEFSGNETGYNQTTYTYYAGDDVLVDDDNGHPLPHGDVIVGQNNLRFGHGTDDIDVVFVRNDKLQLEMEICRVHDSYEEKVLGLENSEPDDAD
jgi:hypothetical protein